MKPQRRGEGKMIPKEKLPKKARREMDKQKRETWLRNPATRVKESGKVYSRKRNGNEWNDRMAEGL